MLCKRGEAAPLEYGTAFCLSFLGIRRFLVVS